MRQVPAACTLPNAEQPLRIAEFTELFAALSSGVDRISPTTAVLDLRADATAEATVRDLTARETECCSFFRFTLTRTGRDRIRLQVEVPGSHVDVLDGLAELATG